MPWARGEKISHLLTGTKQNDPRQEHLHINAPTNLQYASLWQEIITSIKQYGKTKIKNIMKNTCAAFLSAILSRTSVYFVISKLILLFTYSFHVPCIILSNVYFYIVRSMFPFLFNQSRSKASVVNQMSLLFLKLKNIFLLFSTFWKWSYTEGCFDVDQRCETRRSK